MFTKKPEFPESVIWWLPGTLFPTIYKWMFQLDDEPNLYIENGWKSPCPSIYKWLEMGFQVIIFICSLPSDITRFPRYHTFGLLEIWCIFSVSYLIFECSDFFHFSQVCPVWIPDLNPKELTCETRSFVKPMFHGCHDFDWKNVLPISQVVFFLHLWMCCFSFQLFFQKHWKFHGCLWCSHNLGKVSSNLTNICWLSQWPTFKLLGIT